MNIAPTVAYVLCVHDHQSSSDNNGGIVCYSVNENSHLSRKKKTINLMTAYILILFSQNQYIYIHTHSYRVIF